MAGLSPLGALLRGALAGAAGTAAMDLTGFGRYKREGGESGFLDWELSRGVTWETAGAPAQVGRRAVEGMFQTTLPDEVAPTANNVVHWGYGMAWGALFGIIEGSLRRPRSGHGLPFALVVWLSGYAILPAMKLYKPIWEYEPQVLWKDLHGHLSYGSTTAGVFKLLAGRD
jgi:hypothetical protein